MVSMHTVSNSSAHLSNIFNWDTCLKYTQQPSKLMSQLFT